MNKSAVLSLVILLSLGAQGARAQDVVRNPSAAVRVRYIVRDVPAATAFSTRKLGFKVDYAAGPIFAALSRGGLQLLLSPPVGPGGASQPMPNGDRPAPGG